MGLNVSRVVDVNISIQSLGLQRAGFGIFNIIGTSPVIPFSERVRAYNDIDGVAEDFLTTDEEYIAANIYFSQSPRPSEVYISRRAEYNDFPNILCSGTNQDPATWAAISDGEFSVTTEAGTSTVTGIDFSAVTTMAEVKTAINAELSYQTDLSLELPSILYPDRSEDNNFMLSNGTATDNFTSYIGDVTAGSGTSIASLMGGEETDGATIIDGTSLETISETLNAIEAVNSKWYGFGFTKEVRDNSQTPAGTIADCLDAAAWAESRIKIFANNSSDVDTLDGTNTTSISYLLNQIGYDRTFTISSPTDYPTVSLFSRGSTVDFSGTNTTINYAFKQLPGITASDLSATQANALEGVNCNYYANFGNQLSGDSVSMVFKGRMASGVPIDEIIGVDWLQNSIETDVFNYLFQSTTKIPQTDAGVAGISSQMEVALKQAVNNGLAAAGYVTIDGNDVYLEKGYIIITGLVEDQSQSSREAREAPPIAFVIKGAGAIEGVTINGTFVR